jgi:Arc/MetJ-type ribon-helix-helix transcriptional regulator
MTVDLKREQQDVIERAIHSGAYHDAGEVISAALEMLSQGIQAENGPPRKSRLWQLREGLSLGDLSIRGLIEEGRE